MGRGEGAAMQSGAMGAGGMARGRALPAPAGKPGAGKSRVPPPPPPPPSSPGPRRGQAAAKGPVSGAAAPCSGGWEGKRAVAPAPQRAQHLRCGSRGWGMLRNDAHPPPPRRGGGGGADTLLLPPREERRAARGAGGAGKGAAVHLLCPTPPFLALAEQKAVGKH